MSICLAEKYVVLSYQCFVPMYTGDSYRRDIGQQHMVSYATGDFDFPPESPRRSVFWTDFAFRAPASSSANAEHPGTSFFIKSV